MTITLAVFDPSAAPAERPAFLAWYAEAVVSTALPTAGLEAWKRQMKDAYPAGEVFAGTAIVVARYSQSDAEDAHTSGFALAGKHGLGFYDVGSGGVWLPDRAGQLVLAHRS